MLTRRLADEDVCPGSKLDNRWFRLDFEITAVIFDKKKERSTG